MRIQIFIKLKYLYKRKTKQKNIIISTIIKNTISILRITEPVAVV